MSYRVLHTITDLTTGGAEMMLLKLLQQQRGGDCDAQVISLVSRGTLATAIEELGVAVHVLDMSPGRPSLSMLPKLRRLVTAFRPDVIQGWMYHGNLLANAAAAIALRRIPVVWSIHQSLDHLATEKPSTRSVIRLGARLSSLPRRIVYCSRHSARQHQEIGYDARRAELIPIGFDCALFRASAADRAAIRAELGIADDTPLIGLVGRYHPLKDQRNFFAAAQIVRRRYPAARFLCAGRGMDAANVEVAAMLDEFDLRGSLFLLGERRDIAALNAAFDIAALSSNSEAFPNVIGEAMASEVPCVVTDVGDAAFIVGDCGRVVPVRNADALAAGFLEMIEAGPEMRALLGRRARARIESEFSLPRVARSYDELYRALPDRRR